MFDQLKVVGKLKIELFSADGVLKDTRIQDNLIVTQGKYGIADQLLAATTIPAPTHMGVGSSATAPAVGDVSVTALGTRVAFDTKTRSNNIVTMVATFAAGNGTGAIVEAGIFNAITAATMYSRIVFAAINKGASDTLQLTWTYTIG